MFSPLADPALLYAAVDRIKREAGSGLNSSLFASPPQLARWAAGGELSWHQTDGTILVKRRDGGFSRLYHIAAGIAELERALAALEPDQPLVADLIGRAQDVAPVSRTYRAAAFREHSSLIRMARIGNPFPDAFEDTSGAGFATPADVDGLHRFLLQLLDPFADQMPRKDELRTAVEQQNVLTVPQPAGSDPQAVLIFERTGLTAILRYWYVDPALHNRGLGGLLMKRFFALCGECRRFLLWVVENNQDGIAKYRHYGFQPDQLTDHIFVRRNA